MCNLVVHKTQQPSADRFPLVPLHCNKTMHSSQCYTVTYQAVGKCRNNLPIFIGLHCGGDAFDIVVWAALVSEPEAQLGQSPVLLKPIFSDAPRGTKHAEVCKDGVQDLFHLLMSYMHEKSQTSGATQIAQVCKDGLQDPLHLLMSYMHGSKKISLCNADADLMLCRHSVENLFASAHVLCA